VDGPFEAQAAVINSPFESLPVSLEGHNQAVVGVSKSSLPSNAISYYEVSFTLLAPSLFLQFRFLVSPPLLFNLAAIRKTPRGASYDMVVKLGRWIQHQSCSKSRQALVALCTWRTSSRSLQQDGCTRSLLPPCTLTLSNIDLLVPTS